MLLLGTGSLLTDLCHSLPILLSLRSLLALEGLNLFLQEKRAGLSIPCNVTASRQPTKGRKRLHCLAAKLFSTQQCRQHNCASCKVNTASTLHPAYLLLDVSLLVGNQSLSVLSILLAGGQVALSLLGLQNKGGGKGSVPNFQWSHCMLEDITWVLQHH